MNLNKNNKKALVVTLASVSLLSLSVSTIRCEETKPAKNLLSDLPVELVFYLWNKLELGDLNNCALLSKGMNPLARDYFARYFIKTKIDPLMATLESKDLFNDELDCTLLQIETNYYKLLNIIQKGWYPAVTLEGVRNDLAEIITMKIAQLAKRLKQRNTFKLPKKLLNIHYNYSMLISFLERMIDIGYVDGCLNSDDEVEKKLGQVVKCYSQNLFKQVQSKRYDNQHLKRLEEGTLAKLDTTLHVLKIIAISAPQQERVTARTPQLRRNLAYSRILEGRKFLNEFYSYITDELIQDTFEDFMNNEHLLQRLAITYRGNDFVPLTRVAILTMGSKEYHLSSKMSPNRFFAFSSAKKGLEKLPENSPTMIGPLSKKSHEKLSDILDIHNNNFSKMIKIIFEEAINPAVRAVIYPCMLHHQTFVKQYWPTILTTIPLLGKQKHQVLAVLCKNYTGSDYEPLIKAVNGVHSSSKRNEFLTTLGNNPHYIESLLAKELKKKDPSHTLQ